MDEKELALDGNAAAGILSEVFVGEMTASPVMCMWCGAVTAMAEEHLYMFPLAPGAVLRCSTCEEALMVFVRHEGMLRVGLPGVRWLDIATPS